MVAEGCVELVRLCNDRCDKICNESIARLTRIGQVSEFDVGLGRVLGFGLDHSPMLVVVAMSSSLKHKTTARASHPPNPPRHFTSN